MTRGNHEEKVILGLTSLLLLAWREKVPEPMRAFMCSLPSRDS